MFNSSKIGLLLFLTHLFSSLTVGIIFRNYKKSHTTLHSIPQVSIKSNTNSIKLADIGSVASEAISSSIKSLFLILGYMVFFAVLSNILIKTNTLNCIILLIEKLLKIFSFPSNFSTGIICGILEITNGIHEISILRNIDINKILPIVALILGFGGFSVHMQVASIISPYKLSFKPYLIRKNTSRNNSINLYIFAN